MVYQGMLNVTSDWLKYLLRQFALILAGCRKINSLSLNWLKNDFTEEYSFDILDLKNLLEKGLFHLFGELFTAEVNSVRLGPFPNLDLHLAEVTKVLEFENSPKNHPINQNVFCQWEEKPDNRYVPNMKVFEICTFECDKN